MDPHRLLSRLAGRHGVPPHLALRLEPMVARALEAREPVRSRLLGLVERTLVREAQRQRERELEQRDREERALEAIAKLLHKWRPPSGFDADWLADGR